jgi:hypothetical protein
LFLIGAFTIGQAAQPPPPPPLPKQTKKIRTRPSRAPRAHSVSTHPQAAGATATPQRPNSRRHIPVGATHVAAIPGTPAVCVEASSTRPTGVRPQAVQLAAPPLCPPHVSTRPLPTRAERTSAYQGGPVFVPSRLRLPSAAASGTPVLRLPPRGFRSDIDPPPRPPPVSPH